MVKFRVAVGVLLRAATCVVCLILAECDVVPPSKLSDEEWEAGLGSDMCPEKQAIPEKLEVTPAVVATTVKNPPDLSDVHKLVESQSGQIEKLSDLITRLEGVLHELPAQSLMPKTQDRMQVHSTLKDETTRSTSTEGIKTDLIQTNPPNVQPNSDQVRAEAAAESLNSIPSTDRRREGSSMTVVRYKPAWAEHFQFISAVKVDADVSCLHTLPHEGENGLSRYVAVGDVTGRIYIFLTQGDLLVDWATQSRSPVTAIQSFTLRKNETKLITGHADGSVHVHNIWETVHRGTSLSGDDGHDLTLEYTHSLVLPPSNHPDPPFSHDVGALFEMGPDAVPGEGTMDAETGPGKPVTHVEVYRVGKIRYLLVTDTAGKMQVFRENGTLFGIAHSPSRPLAFLRTPNTQRLLFLTKSGAGSLDLRSMTVRSSPCEGLNSSTVVAYTFDAAGRSRAYGFTAEGYLVFVALSGDTLHFECHARPKRQLDVEGPISPHGIKGYLLVATPTHVSVYNTTLQAGFSYANIRVGGQRPLFTASMSDIARSFVSTPITQGRWPVMACNRDKLVVLGFGEGYVAMYSSNLPVYKMPDFNAKLWSSPIFICVLLLIAGWHFLSRKREPVSTESAAMQLGGSSSSPSSFRKYEDGRAGFREGRDGGLGEARRYESPSRYGSKPAPYGPGSISYRTASSEPSSYSARREPLFANQTVGDLRH